MCYFFLPDSVYPCCYVSALNHCNALGGFVPLLWVAAQPGLGEGRDLHAFPCSGLAAALCSLLAPVFPTPTCLQPLFSPLCPQFSLHAAPPPFSPASSLLPLSPSAPSASHHSAF